MVIETKGTWQHGSQASDVQAYLTTFQAGGYPVHHVAASVCAACDGTVFAVLVDDDEGYVARRCASCNAEVEVLDSAEFREDAEADEAACPCGGERFEMAVGFSLLESGEVRWVSVGLRCVADGLLGCYADWKIDYEPSGQLLHLA